MIYELDMEVINKLGLMAWPLIFCSIIILAIILERIVFIIKYVFYEKSHIKKIFNSLDSYKNIAKNLRDEYLSIELQNLQKEYYKGVKLLRMLGTISPLLGLLGTILGIISAFKVISEHTTHVSPNMIADGLWEAMLTTAFGLFIAIPALLFANLLKYFADNKLNKLALELNYRSLTMEVL